MLTLSFPNGDPGPIPSPTGEGGYINILHTYKHTYFIIGDLVLDLLSNEGNNKEIR